MTLTEEDVKAARESDDKLNKALKEREAHEASAREALAELEKLQQQLNSQNAE